MAVTQLRICEAAPLKCASVGKAPFRHACLIRSDSHSLTFSLRLTGLPSYRSSQRHASALGCPLVESYWAVARLQPSREQVAFYFLEHAGFQIFSPRVRERRLRRGRWTDFVGPLFPSYVFVAIEMGQWYCARWCPAVSGLIMNGEKPAAVPELVIARLRERERGGVLDFKGDLLKVGDCVAIVSGVLAGHIGLFAGMAPHDRVAVLLDLLGATRRVKIRREAIEPVGGP
jgi:transcriptional antiterminator RfaH